MFHVRVTKPPKLKGKNQKYILPKPQIFFFQKPKNSKQTRNFFPKTKKNPEKPKKFLKTQKTVAKS